MDRSEFFEEIQNGLEPLHIENGHVLDRSLINKNIQDYTRRNNIRILDNNALENIYEYLLVVSLDSTIPFNTIKELEDFIHNEKQLHRLFDIKHSPKKEEQTKENEVQRQYDIIQKEEKESEIRKIEENTKTQGLSVPINPQYVRDNIEFCKTYKFVELRIIDQISYDRNSKSISIHMDTSLAGPKIWERVHKSLNESGYYNSTMGKIYKKTKQKTTNIPVLLIKW